MGGPQPSSRPSSEGPPFGSDLSLRTRTFFENPRSPPPFVGGTKPMVQQFCGDSCLINQKNEKKKKKNGIRPNVLHDLQVKCATGRPDLFRTLINHTLCHNFAHHKSEQKRKLNIGVRFLLSNLI